MATNGVIDATASSTAPTPHAPLLQQIRQSSKESTGSSDTDSSSDDESATAGVSTVPVPPASGVIQPDKVPTAKETEAGAEISALVNYVQPVHFSSFENSESKYHLNNIEHHYYYNYNNNFNTILEKNRCYEMSSFDEKQATTLLKERPIEFVNYNKHQLSRVYPAGTRFDSSNFMPQVGLYRIDVWDLDSGLILCTLVVLECRLPIGGTQLSDIGFGNAIESRNIRVQSALWLFAKAGVYATQGSAIGSVR